MPRLIWDIAVFLQRHTRREHLFSDSDLHTFMSCVGVYLVYIFGWCDDTAARLALSDIALDQATTTCIFRERFCKGAFSKADQLHCRLDYTASNALGLASAISLLLSPPVQARLPDEFLRFVSKGKVPPASGTSGSACASRCHWGSCGHP